MDDTQRNNSDSDPPSYESVCQGYEPSPPSPPPGYRVLPLHANSAQRYHAQGYEDAPTQENSSTSSQRYYAQGYKDAPQQESSSSSASRHYIPGYGIVDAEGKRYPSSPNYLPHSSNGYSSVPPQGHNVCIQQPDSSVQPVNQHNCEDCDGCCNCLILCCEIFALCIIGCCEMENYNNYNIE